MKALFGVLAVASSVLVMAPAQAVTILHDDFEGESAASVLNYDAFANWDVLNGSVDLVKSGDFGINCRGQVGFCVDLDGTSGDAGDLTSKAAFDIMPGMIVTLQFDYHGNQRVDVDDTMTVSFGSLYTETFADIFFDQSWQTVVRSFTTTAPVVGAKLVFSHEGGDNFGILLDDVKVDVEPIPVPPAMLLMGSVLGFAAWRARRAKKA